jgi:hypothetical protein
MGDEDAIPQPPENKGAKDDDKKGDTSVVEEVGCILAIEDNFEHFIV